MFDAAARGLPPGERDPESRRRVVRQAWRDIADLLHERYWRRLLEMAGIFVPPELRIRRVMTRLGRADLASAEFQFLLLE